MAHASNANNRLSDFLREKKAEASASDIDWTAKKNETLIMLELLSKFRAMRKSTGKIRLEPPSIISEFRGALNLRDWLAHGRYWNPKLGRKHSPEDVLNISKMLVDSFRNSGQAPVSPGR